MSDDAADLRDIATSRIASGSSNVPMHRLVRAGDDRLILRPGSLLRGIGLGLCGLAALMMTAWARSNAGDGDAHAFVGGFLALVGVGMCIAPQRVVLDRTRDVLSKRNLLFGSRYRLSDVAAVQVIDGGQHRVKRSTPYHTRELNLVLRGPSFRRINLTNHGDNRATRAMADEIAAFLGVPFLNRFAHEAARDAGEELLLARARRSRPAMWLRRAALAGYAIAALLGLFSGIMYLQQAKLDALEAELVVVQARLLSSDVREWNAGQNDWSAFGKFDVETPPYTGPATGELIPSSYYREHHIKRTSGGAKIARKTADEFVAKWEIGKRYEAFLYPEAKDRLFFERPGAEKNAENVRWTRNAALLCFAVGLAISTLATFINRNIQQ